MHYEFWIFHALDPDPTPKAGMFVRRILEATTVPAGLDEDGTLKGGWIRLAGKMKGAFTRGDGFARQDCEGVYDFHEGKAREVGIIKYDLPLEAPPGTGKVIDSLCLLPRAERHGDSVGLALAPTGRKNEYCRVGLVSLIQLSWYEVCAEEEISIV